MVCYAMAMNHQQAKRLLLVGVLTTASLAVAAPPVAQPDSVRTYSCTNCFGARPTDCWTSTHSSEAPPADVDFNAYLPLELNAYAAVYLDAHRLGCQTAARDFLNSKLGAVLTTFGDASTPLDTVYDDRQNESNVHPFRAWLAGGMVTHVFAAAWALIDAGTPADDGQLQDIAAVYATIDPHRSSTLRSPVRTVAWHRCRMPTPAWTISLLPPPASPGSPRIRRPLVPRPLLGSQQLRRT